MTAAAAPERERILVVCTGNVCRSPYAALLLQHELDRHAVPVEVVSRGTSALDGHAVAGPVAEALTLEGVPSEAALARALERDDVDRASLVLAMAREHRSAVARLRPRAASRTFTLRQVARLLDVDRLPGGDLGRPVERLVAACAAARGVAAPSAGDADDVLDPWMRDAEAYRTSLGQIRPAIGLLSTALVRLADVGPAHGADADRRGE